MKMFTKTQLLTIVLLIGWVIYEYFMKIWNVDAIGAVIRVDLLLLIPFVISLRQLWQWTIN